MCRRMHTHKHTLPGRGCSFSTCLSQKQCASEGSKTGFDFELMVDGLTGWQAILNPIDKRVVVFCVCESLWKLLNVPDLITSPTHLCPSAVICCYLIISEFSTLHPAEVKCLIFLPHPASFSRLGLTPASLKPLHTDPSLFAGPVCTFPSIAVKRCICRLSSTCGSSRLLRRGKTRLQRGYCGTPSESSSTVTCSSWWSQCLQTRLF